MDTSYNELSSRFKKGLIKNNITEEELQNDYYYIGGDFAYHLIYYHKNNINEPLPKNPSNRCICGHKLRNNIYISNGDKILSLGSSCYSKFITRDKEPKVCKSCGVKHRNRKDNLCMKCRNKFTITKVPEFIILSFK